MNVYVRFTNIFTYGKKTILFLLLLLTASAMEVWGQTPKVADGVYYIKNSNDGGNKWYLWPSIKVTKPSDDFVYEYKYLTTHDGTTAPAVENDNKVSYPAHDNTYPHWIVKNVDGKIQLINPKLNKYVIIRKGQTYNTGADVWLADLPTGEDIIYSYFVLNNASSPYKISPYSSAEVETGKTTANYSFNSKNGTDRTWLTWSPSASGTTHPQLGEDVKGVIQFYNGGTPTWSFTPDLLAAPTINGPNEANKVTVTENNGLPAGYNIRYTVDGTDPTASSDILSGSGYTVTASCTFKAVIERYGIVLTSVASKVVAPGVLKPTFTLNADGSVTITAETGNEIYYTLDGTGPTTSTPTHATTSVIIPSATVLTATAIKAIAYNTSTSESSSVVTFLPVTYTLIDRAGQKIAENISYDGSLELPSEWQSPLVSTYKFYTAATLTGTTYSVDEGDRITTPGEVGDAKVIYVTYDVNSTVTFNTSESELGNTGYMLHFESGDSFNQEDGSDGVMSSATQAAYPYSNGDACLYIYNAQRWNDQLSSGASTRSRWLWHVLSANSDPYRVKIMSHSGQVESHNFFRTYVVEYGASKHIVTGVTTTNDAAVSEPPTEYMILGTDGHFILKTVEPIALDLNDDGDTDDEGESNERRTVTSLEQYWKNNPTVQGQLDEGHKVTDKERLTDDINANSSYWTDLPSGWHTYPAFANAAPWVEWTGDETGTDKRYRKKSHWFQTINMGTGSFDFEFVTLQPQVILLDNHGWEVMRAPLSDLEKLRKYDSPAVSTYHWYPTATKAAGYHKFTISEPAPQIKIYTYNSSTKKWVWTEGDPTYAFTSTTLAANPYEDHSEQPSSVRTDFYVTYDVATDFANIYKGAATVGETSASPVILKQGGHYAKADGSSIDNSEDEVDLGNADEETQWYVKPNFNIDREMGYKYLGESGAQTDALNQSDTEAAYHAANKNGFDPYNVQIQNVSTTTYFTANTSGSTLDGGSWTGTSSSVNLATKSTRQTADGYDHTTLNITNATFMLVNDGNDNLRLMPRFDHNKVVTSFSSLAVQAAAAPKNDNGTATQSLAMDRTAKRVSSTDEMTDMAGYYILDTDFEFNASIGTSANPFTGIIDGELTIQTNTLSQPLVAYAQDAIIRNIIIESTSISTTGPAGAIAATAKGDTRIYNCGVLDGSVGGTTYTGGLVGLLDDNSRVINCYSYATITGGTDVGGIVGHNNHATTAGDIAAGEGTMVMNCMFYGDITGGSKVSPVYGGENINNINTKTQNTTGLNTFNYYAYDKLKSKSINSYNCALAVEEKYLTHFEIYRHLLNSNKRLAAIYATGNADNADKMAKWVLETADRSISGREPYPYPILKTRGEKHPSIVNYDAENAPTISLVDGRPTETDRNKGGKMGTLTVNINVGSGPAGASIKPGKSQITLTRTDKDYDHFNYNYDKVQLPYYNDVGEGNYTGNKVVTGWKITGITAVADDPYTSSNYPTTGIKDYPDHNYADRKSSNKDRFSVSGRVFSQGAYFDIPYGVTEITIEPYWGQAAYVADERYDVVYSTGYDRMNVEAFGKQFSNKQDVDILGDGGTTQKVYTSISDALGSLPNTKSVYDGALVLVGNLHLNSVPSGSDSKGFTMMSIDLDHDNEPDYSLIYHHNGRTRVSPIRFDFLDVIGTAQAQKPNGAGNIMNATIFKTSGWFEITNTGFMYSNQIEYENLDGNNKSDAPLILHGGVFDQFVSTQSKSVTGKTIYIHVGSNVWIQEFGLGTHSDGKESTPHVPVSVTGGYFPNFYLTGTYNQDAVIRTDNAECYISGGRFDEVAGGAQEPIDGNVRWQIYDADIENFYGGGINAAKPIKGNVQTDIYNSHVGVFCGGPKFGDMQTGKTVTTTAEGCTFGRYFGAGFGGTSYSKKKYFDATSYNFSTLQGYYTADRGKYFDGAGSKLDKDYGYKGIGVAADFDYEFFVWSSGVKGARFFVKFASFTLARCNDVFSTLKNCTVTNNFYGGGSYGEVIGKATSVLDGCTVKGNVFGGGYSAQLPKIQVRSAGFTKQPNYNSGSGMFEPGEFSATEEFEWKQVASLPANGNVGIETVGDKKYVWTDVDLTALGKVGDTDLTVQGNTVVEGRIFNEDGSLKEQTGGVFGGGDESGVCANAETTATGSTKVTIKKENGQSPTLNNVFGGGNTADVDGETEVTLTSGTVNHDIYGGGKGAETVVGGDVTLYIGAKDGSTLSGEGTVSGDVYGGSAFGAVNASCTKDAEGHVTAYTPSVGKTTQVWLYGGTVVGNVYGGGLGQTSPSAVIARNFGNTTISMEGGTVSKAVYGGSNVNGVLKADATVEITGGTVGTVPEDSSPISNAVFGGGYGQPTLVEGDVTVNIGTSEQETAGATINGHVYGGGALGSVNASKPESVLVFADTTKTDVNLFKGLIKGNVYGGGLGQKAVAEPATPGIEAYVGGDVNVTLDGAQLNSTFNADGTPKSGQIFGCNNLNGTPKGHVKVWVKRTVGTDKPTDDGGEPANPITRDNRPSYAYPDSYGYDVAAVYGGGNQADYIPTNATLDPAVEGNPAKIAAACAEVVIDDCDLTSIEYVYGGGNAAAVPATDVTINGTYIIDYVFGGGNGKSTASFTNPGANIGSYNNGATNYGTGKAVTKLVGGKIHYVYGGSNTKGNVHGGTSITMPEGGSCELDVKEIYGAGNEAEQDGAVDMVLGCVKDMDVVYGGAKNANVAGGVNLTITSGTFSKVFGGNNVSGTIQGPITLTIEETACDPINIGELYLGGNLAAYSVYGYKDNAGTLVARSSLSDGTAVNPPASPYSASQLYKDPEMNVISCTHIGNVFGGGYGAGATMYGNPTVNINMIPGLYASKIDRDGTPGEDGDATALGEIVNVYGGGNAADVVGDTHINICTEPTVTVKTSMGALIPVGDRTPTDVAGAYITGNVFGAGLGLSTQVNNTTIVMAGGSVAKSVYGGGELGRVEGDTHITVRGGEIGDSELEHGGETIGNVYGGGKGNTSDVRAGLIKGNTNITIQNTVADAAYNEAHPETAVGTVLSSPSIYHNIYGGGAHGSVGTYTYESEDADAAITGYTSDGTANITITGGTIGINGHENGMVFGSSRGDIDRPNTIYDKVAWVYDTHVTIGTEGAATGPTIHGSLYGSGENGHTYHDAEVIMYSGTVGNPAEFYACRGNVYGAGCGTDKYYADPEAETHDGNGTLYNPKAGIVQGNATVTINGGSIANNIYGAGAMGKVGGNTSVIINTDGSVGVDGDNDDGNVYGAARGELGLSNDYASVTNSSVTIRKGTVKGSVYGGGRAGVVTGAVTVSLEGGTVLHDAYGGGALAQTNTSYAAGSAPANTYTTTITSSGTNITGDLYGGGLGRLAVAGVAGSEAVYFTQEEIDAATEGDPAYGKTTSDIKTPAVEAVEAVSAVAANVNGPVTVALTGGHVARVFGCNNLNGAPQRTVNVEIGAKDGSTLSGTGTVLGSVYGGGNLAAYAGTTAVKLYGGTVNTDVFGGGLGATAVTGGSSVTMEGGVVNHDVYGGGSQADVTGNVSVNISGGKVINDVYGGGALANTNTANWDSTVGNKDIYIDVTSVLTVGTSSVYGLYEGDGHTYISDTEKKAEAGKKYYEKRTLPGQWADGMDSDDNTTTVTLTGGIIGNVYGGGLGNETTPVYVFGDITVNVNRPADMTGSSPGVAFTYRSEIPTIAGVNYASVPLTGNVFGCNNIKGSPLGDVTVGVYSTRQIDESGTYLDGHSPNGVIKTYEIQAVYGGGNQANYQPAEGKGTHVIIDGCGETSISNVYGGGSAASVPATDVVIWGSYDIGYAFGGGNGFYKIKKNGAWADNDGADVEGLASITVHGGKIGEIFGGSDAKGVCRSTSSTQAQEGSCPLILTKLYGAGKEADVDGNVNVVISACTEGNSEIEYVCGGSYKAHISGDVTLTITSGYFKNVYGGNDQRGGIGGNITVNIEETENCEKPIIIQNLVGGSNKADYPGEDKTGTPFPTGVGHPHKITVNVKSATRIDNIFGGSFLAEANADTEVNINMVRGNKSGLTNVPLPSYYGEPGATLPTNIRDVSIGYEEVTGLTVGTSSVVGYYIRTGTEGNYTYTPAPASGVAQSGTTYCRQTVTGTIASAIGTIGNIFGGGNEGIVNGNAVVNIGTSSTVPIMERTAGVIHADKDGSGKITKIYYTDETVLGAHIDGDVFGGGYQADVTGNDTVNYCTLDYSKVSYSGTTGFEGFSVGGSIYGGGSKADVLKNTYVKMSGGYVFNSIFGGGLAGSVGTFTRSTEAEDVTVFGHTPHAGCIGRPMSCADGTGLCKVVVNGGQIGPVAVATQGMTRAAANGGPVVEGWVWGAGQGVIEDPSVVPDTHFKSYVGSTDVTIGDSAFIVSSIIGGGEFGRVLGNTLVTIQDTCQIGVGAGQTKDEGLKPKRYTEAQWTAAAAAVASGNASDIATAAASMPACSHFPYENPYLPYDPYYDDFPSTHIGPASTANPSDGHTRIGCVWGGGSGHMPYKKADGTGYEWLRSAGLVSGSTKVLITGGHILTNVYGGNEYTDVTGDSCVVIMTGGTIGVPRTKAQIREHPLIGYLFGGGKGDQRSHFNHWTDVKNTRVYVGGTARIYGSVFGGGEDGHVTDSTKIQVYGGSIGSVGTSGFDGNVFGGGRGFSGTALTAGSISGNTRIDIHSGTVLGNVYGGGRMASVGVNFSGTQDSKTGQFTEDGGNVTINIGGSAIIGNDDAEETALLAAGGHTTGGNVYGGGMGRLTLLDGETSNPLWVKMAQAKSATINISGSATVKSNVYGGPELGTTRDNATINLSGSATVNGSVYGGGYGSEESRDAYIGTIDAVSESSTITYRFTPMQYAGCLGGDTHVNISGGTVGKNVYGGGELATVGVIDYLYADGDYVNIKAHRDSTSEFALSWPYDLPYLKDGKANVTVTNGRIGGSVYGGGKGKAMPRYQEAFCANVRETEVKIHYGSTAASTTAPANCIVGEVYGGGQDGHVMGDASVDITGGLIGQSVYGGGQGEGTYKGYLRNQSTGAWNTGEKQDLTSWTAGKVYGNTSLTMSGGRVLDKVYGGGNLASVGKGNYAGGTDDYFPTGYGETLTGNLWTSGSSYNPSLPVSESNKPDDAWHFLHSGKATVAVTGGEVGSLNGISGTVFGTSEVTPTGMVFGGSRGRSAQDVMLDPRHEYAPDFYLGYVNSTEVTIGKAATPAVGTEGEEGYVPAVPASGPRIFSQVFGGGRDGHVRGSTHVVVNEGTIGQTYAETEAAGGSTADYQRYHRGNVYGSGSGLGMWDGEHHGMSSGSVTRNTTVDIYGGTIYNNVYGGGALSCVGPPLIGTTEYAPKTWSLCKVNIRGGTIGIPSDYEAHEYGGCVYGASRGRDFAEGESVDNFATTIWNDVNISGGTIAGNVYGGGQAGRVKKDNTISLTGGVINHDAYGGGRGTSSIAADVGGNTTVELNRGVTDEKGCVVNKIFGCNDLNGTPKGHALVHVYATQNKGAYATVLDKPDQPVYDANRGNTEGYKAYLTRLIDEASTTGGYLDAEHTAITGANTLLTSLSEVAEGDLSDGQKSNITNAAKAIISALEALFTYDVAAVYGGGDLAAYEPSSANEETEVIIEGCDVTSIQQVYGGGNAASVPASNVKVESVLVIDELFGGGNGKDNYVIDDVWYENPGANVGYKRMAYYVKSGETGYDAEVHGGTGADEASRYKAITYDNADTKEERQDGNNKYMYGTGVATTTITGGHIHHVYGGSNIKGNIREVALSKYQKSGACPLITDETYGGSKSAEIDAEIQVVLDCVDYGGTYYGGSQDSDINNNVTINITNGTFDKVFGGNNLAGTINGAITINIEESGCTPIFIGELYGGGNEADYSVYGYRVTKSGDVVTERVALKKGETGALETPHRDPQINIISATHIGSIYGGGYKAKVIGSPTVNVNMTNGIIAGQYADDDKFDPGTHTVDGNTYEVISNDGIATLAVGTIGNIYGGGNMADVIGNTCVEIGTGQWHNRSGDLETLGTDGKTYRYNTTSGKWEYLNEGDYEAVEGTPTPARKEAFITGNIYGGGKMGHVGDFTLDGNGKPISCTAGTGTSTVVISNGKIGPDNMTMYHLDGSGNVLSDDHPDDFGHVFGGGQGTLDYYYDASGMTDEEKVAGMKTLTKEQMNAKVALLAFVDTARVTINGSAFVKGSVFGGAENGHVLHNTYVNIADSCQIGNGHVLLTDGSGNITANRGVNRRYTSDEWAQGKLIGDANWTSNSLPECAAWPYGATIAGNKLTGGVKYAPYDKFADYAGYEEEGGSKVASSGRTFYGNVFAGGSGFYPYAPGKWLETAGEVEGNAYVNVTGGHILTNLYGGNEMSSVLGDTYVTMTGGTVGVPRTVAETTAHPVTCYVFGGGKGEARSYLNHDTNVRNAHVTISGGWIYGSVFGGAEDGHVLGDATVNVSGNVGTSAQALAGTATRIGTWGSSYVDGNIFGGGRGFDGHNLFAGCIEGNVTMNISGGEMLGSIYGGGRLGSVGINSSGQEMADTESETHGHVTIDISGGTIGNDLEFKYYTFDVENTASKTWAEIEKAKKDSVALLDARKVTDNIPLTEFQVTDSIQNGADRTYIYRLAHTKGGNVYAGGMGRLRSLDGDYIPYWFNLGGVKDTRLTIRGEETKIKGNVYGGCELGQVAGTHKVFDAYHRVKGSSEKDEYAWPETLTSILIQGGTIGSEIKDDGDETQYTYGSVFGSGYGDPTERIDYEVSGTKYESNPKFSSGLVEGSTRVEMQDGTVLGSIYGGGQVGNTHGNSVVTITGGTIGMANMGDLRSGNVFGGGFGNRTIVRCGQIYGNATVSISGTPTIHHHVYGGGAYGSVGQFKYDTRTDPIHLTPKVYGVERLKKRTDLTDALAPSGTTPAEGSIIEPEATGRTTVTITGGTVGTDGLADGCVFGSSYGDVANPLQRDDFLGWVYDANVVIGDAAKGTDAGGTGTDYSTPLIRGNVYGSGDNGHTFNNATVAVHSGTIGLTEAQTKDAEGEEGYKSARRGNVYGAGNGIETYNIGTEDLYKGQAGIVYGNTTVNIDGGLIVHNVYGGGEMASVGKLTNDPQAKDDYGNFKYRDTYSHLDETEGFALSWPYEYRYYADGSGNPVPTGTGPIGGKATVNISGGHIGVEGSYGGDVFGGSQGLAGDRYAFDDMSNVRETEVNIAYTATPDASAIGTLTTPGIAGSVHGGAENGHITEDAHVTLDGGLIAHSLYGGGKGKGTYQRKLLKIGATPKPKADPEDPDEYEDDDYYDADIYSLTAGKVYGNTYVTMNDGHVMRNVYGGGNMGSVGKGNYASGTDDYANDCALGAASGYGEKIDGTLWTSTSERDNAWHFLNSGKTTVSVLGGTVGYINESDPGKSMKNNLPYGNVFGGSAGESAPNIVENPRYLYSPAFYSGYVNETDVTIGADGTDGPTILASVYGGGQDGHVRRDTHVKVKSGEIGLPYTDDNRTLLQTNTRSVAVPELDHPQWLHRGNVYGAGSGISRYKYDFDYSGTTSTDANENGTIEDDEIETSTYNGNPIKEEDYSNSSGSVTRFTRVDIQGGTIHRNVYGGGSLASVGPPDMGQTYAPYSPYDTSHSTDVGRQSFSLVNISGGSVGSPTDYNDEYGGEVYGASRGIAELRGKDDFSFTIWTLVNILDGADIKGNVFGGGDSGIVKKNAEVIVGATPE